MKLGSRFSAKTDKPRLTTSSVRTRSWLQLTAVSLIYTTSFAGSMFGALINMWITDRLGFGIVTPLGALSSAICFLLAGTGAPFGVFLLRSSSTASGSVSRTRR